MKHRDTHDLIGGLCMTATGVFFALYGDNYSMGTAARMGPGYFPVILGWILAVLGLLIAWPAWFRQGGRIVVQWKNLFWSVLSILFFAFALKTLGLVAGTFLTCFLALVPSKMPLRTRFVVCASVTILTALIFWVGLQMILPIWPWSI
ncbi:tripartite tricarboxylate transporter TctB family protein [Comamonadaceae bacterium PP-2]